MGQGIPLAVDATMVSVLHASGEPWNQADVRAPVVIEFRGKSKEDTYPELVGFAVAVSQHLLARPPAGGAPLVTMASLSWRSWLAFLFFFSLCLPYFSVCGLCLGRVITIDVASPRRSKNSHRGNCYAG